MLDLDLSSTAVAVLSVLGVVVVPALTSLFKRASWGGTPKKILAGVIAGLSAAGLVFVEADSFSVDVFLQNAFLLWTTAQVSYRNLWAGTVSESKLSAVGPS